MPWIEVAEPHAEPPRLPRRALTPSSSSLELDGRWAELIDVETTGQTIDLESCSSLEIRSSRLSGVRFENAEGVDVEVRDSEFVDCDLSRMRFRSVGTSTFDGCKLTGADLSGAQVRDVRWRSSRFALANLRMATFERVQWHDCVVEECDLFDSTLTDVDLAGSSIIELNLDRARFERVDFRSAGDLQLSSFSTLKGALFSPSQLPAMAFTLATALGADIESDAAE